MVIQQRTFKVYSEAQASELKKLQKIAESESGHLQIWKQTICLILLASSIGMNAIMKKVPCGGLQYWGVQGVFVAICVVTTLIAIRLNKQEQRLKRKYRVNFYQKEIDFDGSSLIILVLAGLMGGFVAGSLGLGGGSVYCPILLTLGMNPRSAGATSIYLVLFSAISASAVNLMFGILDLSYAIYVSIWAVLGTFLVLWKAEAYVRKTGKHSTFVWSLVAIFVISCIVQPIFGWISIKALQQDGEKIFAWVSICE